jgi:hypothetical protein
MPSVRHHFIPRYTILVLEEKVLLLQEHCPAHPSVDVLELKD